MMGGTAARWFARPVPPNPSASLTATRLETARGSARLKTISARLSGADTPRAGARRRRAPGGGRSAGCHRRRLSGWRAGRSGSPVPVVGTTALGCWPPVAGSPSTACVGAARACGAMRGSRRSKRCTRRTWTRRVRTRPPVVHRPCHPRTSGGTEVRFVDFLRVFGGRQEARTPDLRVANAMFGAPQVPHVEAVSVRNCA